MFSRIEERIDRLVNDLLRGRRLRPGAADLEEREAIIAAAALAAGRQGHPRMSPAFRRRLAADLRQPAGTLVTRRTALGAVAGLAAGAAGAAALTHLPGSAGAPERAASAIAGGVMKPGGGRWIEVAALSTLSEAAPTRVVAGDVVAYLFRTGNQVRGLSGVCSDLPCNLHWRQAAGASGVLTCPCHNVDFDADGRSDGYRYSIPSLPVIQVRVEGDRVLVFSP